MLPRRLRPDPIIDATVEIRFTPLIDKNAVFGVLYFSLKDVFPSVENLPIVQLPEIMREQDPLFAFRPLYRLYNDNYQVQIGYNVLSIHSLGEYPGWDKFSEVIFNVLKKVQPLEVIGNINRLGVRYISFFEVNIFKELILQLSVPNYPKTDYHTILRMELPSDRYVNILQLSNKAIIQKSGLSITGSIVDIDTNIIENMPDFFTEMKEHINKAHQAEKDLFYSLLKPEFLKSLNPEY